MNSAKIIRSLVCLMVCAVMVFSVSCSGGEVPRLLDFLGDPNETVEANFNGYEFVMAGAPDVEAPEAENTIIRDELLQRYKDVEKEYNCDIVVRGRDDLGDYFIRTITTSIASDVKYADIVMECVEFIFEASKLNILKAVDTIDGVDISSGIYGQQSMLDAIRYVDGHVYGFQPDQWPLIQGVTIINFMLFNNEVLKEYGLASPHEYMEQNAWTWEAFRQAATTCTNLSEDIYGCIYEHDDFILDAIFSNDGTLLAYNESTGKYYPGVMEKEAVEAMEWVKDLVTKDRCITSLSFIGGENSFTSGDSAFAVMSSGYAFGTPLDVMDEGFAWASFPYGPSNEDGSWNPKLSMYANYYAVPNYTDFEDFIFSTITKKLFAPVESLPNWKEYYKQYMIADPTGKSGDIFIEMLDTVESAHLHVFTRTGRCNCIVDPLEKIQAGHLSVAEAFTSKYDRLQGFIDDVYNVGK